MDNCKISVIIPVYNAEQYLEQCLDSIISSTLKEIEIICVDDGSTDSSPDIVKRYIENDNRIKYLSQKNQYAGAARNLGLRHASGEYCTFIDSDDFIDPNGLEKLYKIASSNHVDMLKCSSVTYDNQTHEYRYDDSFLCNEILNSTKNKVTTFKDNIDEWIEGADTPWSGIYRREFLVENDILFNTLRCANDRSFYYNCLLASDRIMVTDVFLNFYRINVKGSLVDIRSSNFECQIKSYQIIKGHVLKFLPSELTRIMYRELTHVIQWIRMLEGQKRDMSAVLELICSFAGSYDIGDVGIRNLTTAPFYDTFLEYGSGSAKTPSKLLTVLTNGEPTDKNDDEVDYVLLSGYSCIREAIKEADSRYILFAEAPFSAPYIKSVVKNLKSENKDIVRFSPGKAYYETYDTASTIARLFENSDKLPALSDVAVRRDIAVIASRYIPSELSETVSASAFLFLLGTFSRNMVNVPVPDVCYAPDNVSFGDLCEYSRAYLCLRNFIYSANSSSYLLKSLNNSMVPFVSKCIELSDGKEKELVDSWYNYPLLDMVIDKKTGVRLSEYSVKYCDIPEYYKPSASDSDTAPKITIVIPVYNTAPYLKECLDSILSQNLTDIEVICVNDGSLDDSLQIIESYREKDKRVAVLSQHNKGLATARNAGFSHAKGKYTIFADSDDMFKAGALDVLYKEMEEKELDVLLFGADMIVSDCDIDTSKKFINAYNDFPECEPQSGLSLLTKMISDGTMRVNCTTQISRTDHLRTIGTLFIDGTLHEDNGFTFKNLTHAGQTARISSKNYLRRVRPNSIMTEGPSFDNYYGYLRNIMLIESEIKMLNTDNENLCTLNSFAANLKSIAAEVFRQIEDTSRISALSPDEKSFSDSIIGSTAGSSAGESSFIQRKLLYVSRYLKAFGIRNTIRHAVMVLKNRIMH